VPLDGVNLSLKARLCLTLLLVNPPALASDFDLTAYKGQVVYLDFWASWCGPCRASFPWMNAMQAKYSQQGLKIIAVNEDSSRKDASAFLEKHAANFEIFYDENGKLAKRLQLKGMPTSYLFDRNGQLIMRHPGFRNSDKAALDAKLKHALESK
jgi:thiol-disulfide isomerase/thioredoxin